MKKDIQPFKRGRERLSTKNFNAASIREKAFIIGLAGALVLALLFLINTVNKQLSVEVPVRGGSHSEGIVGFPRFINPVTALGDADRDLASLVYSGLLSPTSDGAYVTDLALSWNVSPNGLRYTVTLRDDARFHDGELVTADDVIFTIEATQDPIIRSPRRASWDGVGVEKVSDREIAFILERPFPPFLENLTMGILPEHIWGTIDPGQFAFSFYNIEPIGSGPYRITSVDRSRDGIPRAYTLESFEDYTRGEPYIEKLSLSFFQNAEDRMRFYTRGNTQGIPSVDPAVAAEFQDGAHVVSSTLPRIFGVFFNQSTNVVLQERAVRDALSQAVDRRRLVNEVLYGFGEPITGPLPARLIGETAQENTEESFTGYEEAEALLVEAGWQRSEENGIMEKTIEGTVEPLSFTLSTSNTAELSQTALMLKDMWERIGAVVEIEYHSSSDLKESVIRPRAYEAILFGEVVGRELDYFAFWHSSQRNDPGLNIAAYTNSAADNILREAREIPNRTDRISALKEFDEIVREEVPAVFLYSPDFIYVLPENIKGTDLDLIATPSERFMNIHEWYKYTQHVLKIFSK